MPSQPQRPDGNRQRMLAVARSLAAGDSKANRAQRLSYTISGGAPGSRLQKTLAIAANGAVSLNVRDDLAGRKIRRQRAVLTAQLVRSFFSRLVESRLFENVDSGSGFLPDSLIGCIRLEDGEAGFSYYFLADEAQRKQQGKDLNPSLSRMISALEALETELFDQRGQEPAKGE